MKTRVILREDLPALGMTGEVVEVTSGYARNFLIPLQKAYAYSEDSLKRVEKDRKVAEVRRKEVMAEFEVLAARLSQIQLTFEEKVSEEGHLYGSVNAQRIAASLAEHGVSISERNIRLDEPLKETGEYEIPIHVHGEVEANVKVWVVAGQTAEA